MLLAVRALFSLAMLVGFYVLALIQLVVGMMLAGWLGSVTAGIVAAYVGKAVLGATVWAVGYGTWKALRTERPVPDGLPLSRATAPQLWATVDQIATVAGTRAPDEIYVVPQGNAGVEERSRLMGLVGGRRYMHIGMPLLQTFTVAQLRSVLAHELGHYSGRHTRLAAVSYRGRLALDRTVSRFGRLNIAGWVFKAYAALYVMVEHSVSRRQELAADLASVRVASRKTAAGALRKAVVLAAASELYLDQYVRPSLKAGYAPDDLFAGFSELLAHADEIPELRAAGEERSAWDTHPPLSTRLAAIMAAPEPLVPVDDRPAGVLVPDLACVARALQDRVLGGGKLTILPWAQFTTAAASARLQQETDELLLTISRAVEQPVPHASAVLDHIAAGRLFDIAAKVFPDMTRLQAANTFAQPLANLFSLAAVRSGVAHWQHSWTGPAKLVGPYGAALDLSNIARLATDPATLHEARRELARLGVDIAGADVEQQATVEPGLVCGGIINMMVADQRTDILILTYGLLLVPDVTQRKASSARQQMTHWIEGCNPRNLVAAEGNRFIPYQEIVAGPKTRKFIKRYELTLRSGEKLDIRWSSETESVGNGSRAMLAGALWATTHD